MKKVFLITLFSLISFCFCITVEADTSISLYAPDVQVQNNRLFDIDILADCNKNLTAATFELTYDDNIMEYRSISTDVPDGEVKAVADNGKVKAVFLQADGIKNGNDIKLFSVKFKSVATGNCDVKISAWDCVDDKVLELNCNPVTTCKITVPENSVSVDTNINSSTVDSYYNETVGKGSLNKANDQSQQENVNYLSVAPNAANQERFYFFAIFSIGVLGLVCMYLLKQVLTLKKKQNKNTTEEK